MADKNDKKKRRGERGKIGEHGEPESPADKRARARRKRSEERSDVLPAERRLMTRGGATDRGEPKPAAPPSPAAQTLPAPTPPVAPPPPPEAQTAPPVPVAPQGTPAPETPQPAPPAAPPARPTGPPQGPPPPRPEARPPHRPGGPPAGQAPGSRSAPRRVPAPPPQRITNLPTRAQEPTKIQPVGVGILLIVALAVAWFFGGIWGIPFVILLVFFLWKKVDSRDLLALCAVLIAAVPLIMVVQGFNLQGNPDSSYALKQILAHGVAGTAIGLLAVASIVAAVDWRYRVLPLDPATDPQDEPVMVTLLPGGKSPSAGVRHSGSELRRPKGQP